MRATPERPGFLLLWIAGVTGVFSVIFSSLLPTPPAASRRGAGPAAVPDSAISQPGAHSDAAAARWVAEAAGPGPSGASPAQSLASGVFEATGRLEDFTGKPCCGAQVALLALEQSEAAERFPVDDSGSFRIGGLVRAGEARLVAWVRGSEYQVRVRLEPRAGLAELGVVRLDLVAQSMTPAPAAPASLRTTLEQRPSLRDSDGEPVSVLRLYLPMRRGGRAGEAEREEEEPVAVELLAVRGGFRLRFWLLWAQSRDWSQASMAEVLEALPEPLVEGLRRALRPRAQRGHDGDPKGRQWLEQLLVKAADRPGVLDLLVHLTPQRAEQVLRGWLTARHPGLALGGAAR
ncbi:MAG: hypothetical protein EYC70_03985 [Planctomycetota bacterium]|nr:MAG: hypothetical protein EYC70_03985 [Planctomycetota bacterium]